ncbi:MAG: response regulator [Deltaproteobacteria bacterium]|nr:response regulator [Deltaproteobacteria bacterium]
MNDNRHTILCVDDEENILHSIKRLLRKEGYRLLTASNGVEGLKILKENNVHLVLSDQRMPQMSGTEFLAEVKEKYPDVIRIILTGYTQIDSITESINKGNIYKFLLKPWNDQNLKLEIGKALEQYDLIQANKSLHEKVLEQNEELKRINENLEMLIQERTKDLEIQNQALELSRAILEDLPVPVIGVSVEGMIVLINRQAQSLSKSGKSIEIGKRLSDYFSNDMEKTMEEAMISGTSMALKGYRLSGTSYHIDLIPLSGKFSGKGVVLYLRKDLGI